MTRYLLILALLFSLVGPVSAQNREGVYPPPKRVHVMRGLWSRDYRVEEGIAAAGGAVCRDSWATGGMGFGWPGNPGPGKGGLDQRPSAAQLAQTDLVIMVNVNPAALGKSQQALADWVKEGGQLLILGGRFAYGPALRDGPLAEISPVTVAGQGFAQMDLQQTTGGSVVVAPDSGLAAIPGRYYWYHQATPVDGATVMAQGVRDEADSATEPLVVQRDVGRGRVVAFLGSVMGDGDDGFWTQPEWPAALASIIKASWIPYHQERANGAITLVHLPKALKALEPVADPLEPPTEAQVAAAWTTVRHTMYMERGSAAGLAKAFVTLPRDIPEDVALYVGRLLLERTPGDATLTAVGQKLLESGQPNKTLLGLYVMGGSEDTLAIPTLTDFFDKPEPRQKAAGGGGLDMDLGGGAGLPDAGLQDAKSRERAAFLYRAAVLQALVWRANTADKALATTLHKSLQDGAYKVSENLESITDRNRLWQLSLLALLASGDDAVAPTLAAQLLENRFLVSRQRSEHNKPDERLETLARELPVNLDWQASLYAQLATLPDERAAVLATAIATLPDRRAGQIAVALAAGRPDSAATRAALAGSPIPAVAAGARD